MIHGRDRAAVLAQVDRIKELCGLKDIDCAVLFSGRRFKQRGARYAAGTEAHPEAPLAAGPGVKPTQPTGPRVKSTSCDLHA
jgi:hypothetical protein